MAITFVSSAFAYDSAIDNSLVVSAPSSIQDGDILLITGYEDGGTTASCTGFTSVFDGRLYCLWKRASSESGDYTINFSGAVEGKAAIISVWRGCLSSGSPVDVSNNNVYNTSDKKITCYGVTTTVANAMLVAFGIYGGSDLSFTQPTSFTKITANDYYDTYWGENVPGAYYVQATAGASGDKVFTTSGSATTDKAGALLALKPATDGGGSAVYLPQIMCCHTIPRFAGGY